MFEDDSTNKLTVREELSQKERLHFPSEHKNERKPSPYLKERQLRKSKKKTRRSRHKLHRDTKADVTKKKEKRSRSKPMSTKHRRRPGSQWKGKRTHSLPPSADSRQNGAWNQSQNSDEDGLHRKKFLRVLLEESNLGCVNVKSSSHLSDLRNLIANELDGVPEKFIFVSDGCPIGINQEHKRMVSDCLPNISLRVVSGTHLFHPTQPVTNDISIGNCIDFDSTDITQASQYEKEKLDDIRMSLSPEVSDDSNCMSIITQNQGLQTTQNQISTVEMPTMCVLFASPLVAPGQDRKYIICDSVNYERERDLICQSYKEARKAIRVTFDFATTDRFRTLLTLGCKVLHYSGHANSAFLSFEDGRAGCHFVAIEKMKRLFFAGADERSKGEIPSLCFISACSSQLAGEAFVKGGVKHVICVKSRCRLLDRTTITFTRNFYLALLNGKTVQASFDIGREAVKASPYHDGVVEAGKFLLLPHEDCHNEPVFENVPSINWTPPPAFSQDGLPCPPEGFLGRNEQMYIIIKRILENRLVSICAPKGFGKTAVALAVANYVSERRYFRGGVFYVRLGDVISWPECIKAICRAIRVCGPKNENSMLSALRPKHCLLICDNPNLEHDEIRRLLGQIVQHTRDVRLLLNVVKPLSCYKSQVLFGAGEKVIELPPLSRIDAAELLIRRSPRTIHPEEFNVKTKSELLEKLGSHPIICKYLKRIPGRIVKMAPALQRFDLSSFENYLIHNDEKQNAIRERSLSHRSKEKFSPGNGPVTRPVRASTVRPADASEGDIDDSDDTMPNLALNNAISVRASAVSPRSCSTAPPSSSSSPSYILHDLRRTDTRDQETRDQETRDQETRDQETRDQETRDQETRDQETRDKDTRDQEIRNEQMRDQEARDQEEREQRLTEPELISEGQQIRPQPEDTFDSTQMTKEYQPEDRHIDQN